MLKEGHTGKVADETLERERITLNKNMVPFDPATPFITSGIRIGTPAMTTRGMKEKQMAQIADMITMVLRDINNEKTIARVRSEAKALCDQFPLYPDMV
jgi:glycine hydroxymethyltransferase